jgi:pimeloyl-ACP methyl ester carboxylesterase
MNLPRSAPDPLGWLPGRRAARRQARAEAAWPPSGQFVTVGGGRVHCHVAGNGPDLVLIHGANGNLRDWTFDVVPRLAGRYRLIAMDRPGMGYSDRATRGFADSPADQAVRLQAAAAALGAHRPIVLGHSYGGAVALAWALERPDALSALVLLAAASNLWDGGLGWLYRLTETRAGEALTVPAVAAWGPYGHARRVLDRVFAPQTPPPGYDDHIGIPLILRAGPFRANTRQVNGLKPHIRAMVPRYPAIGVPVEIVHGAADETVPLHIHSEPLARQIPGACLTVLPGIGHMPHHVAAPAVDEAIDRAARRAGLNRAPASASLAT